MIGYICIPGTEFPIDFGQMKNTGSIKNTFLRLYQVLEVQEAKAGHWGTEI